MSNQYKTYDTTSSENRTLWTMPVGHHFSMEAKDRLQQALREAGYDSPTDAWRAHQRALGISKDLLISNSNGNRPISKKAAAIYSKVFGHSPGWYLYGEEDRERLNSFQVPVASLVSAGKLREQPTVMPTDIDRWMTVADLPPGDWLALIVDGDSMNRVAPEGSVIIVNRADSTLLDGRYYVFSLDGGEATFKTFRRSPDRLQPFSTNPDHMSLSVKADADLYVFGRVRRVILDL